MATLKTTWLYLIAVVLIIAHIPSGCAMIGQRTIDITSDNKFTMVWEFEFDAGGTLDLSLDLARTPITMQENNTIQFLLCDDSAVDELRSATLSQVCSTKVFSYIKCAWQTELGRIGDNDHFHVRRNITIPERSWYYILQLNCLRSEFSVEMSWTAMNPGGEYLSLSQVPFKRLYVYLSLLWAGLSSAWVFFWARYRHFNVKIQQAISLAPISQIPACVATLYLWRARSTTGHTPNNLFLWTQFLDEVVIVSFFACFMLIANGYGYLKPTLSQQDASTMGGFLLALFAGETLYRTYYDIFVFIVVFLFIFNLRFIFSMVLVNISKLATQLQLMRSVNIDPSTTPACQKFMILKKFQSSLVTFITMQVVFMLWANVFLRRIPWVQDLIEHSIFVSVCASIGNQLVPKPFRPAYLHVGTSLGGVPAPPSELVIPLVPAAGGDLENPDGGGGYWLPGQRVPSYIDDVNLLSVRDEPTVVLRFPVENDADGTTHRHVAIAKPSFFGQLPSELKNFASTDPIVADADDSDRFSH